MEALERLDNGGGLGRRFGCGGRHGQRTAAEHNGCRGQLAAGGDYLLWDVQRARAVAQINLRRREGQTVLSYVQ